MRPGARPTLDQRLTAFEKTMARFELELRALQRDVLRIVETELEDPALSPEYRAYLVTRRERLEAKLQKGEVTE